MMREAQAADNASSANYLFTCKTQPLVDKNNHSTYIHQLLVKANVTIQTTNK